MRNMLNLWAAVMIAVLSPAALVADQNAANATAAAKASEQFKNLQVIGDIPAEQLMATMHFMRASLGVRCDYCHVAQNGKYDLDTKPEKARARDMLRMTARINRENFAGALVVTCNSCHRGATRPASSPAIGQGQYADTTRGPDSDVADPLPSARSVLERYVTALGGVDAIRTIKQRTVKGTVSRMKVVGAGTPTAAAMNRGDTQPFESVQTPPVIQQDVQLLERADAMTLVGTETLGGRLVYVIKGTTTEGKASTWYFDADTGLMLRRIVFTRIAIGDDPQQTDYEDYRDVGGLKVPYLVKVSYLDDNHLGVTFSFSEIRDVR
jgi:hypothetical protein